MKFLGLLLAAALAFASPALATGPRLTASGMRVLDATGKVINLRGPSFGDGAASQMLSAQDALDIKAMGGTIVRFELSWYRDVDGSGIHCNVPGSINAYNLGQPGDIDPTVLATYDQEVAWATAAGLYVDFAVRSPQCDFWSNATIINQWETVMWPFLATHYLNSNIGFYELMVEPNPGGIYTQTDVTTVETAAVAALRANDPAAMVGIGTVKAYNVRTQFNAPSFTNEIGVADFFEPGKYVNQAAPPNNLAYPGLFSDDGADSGSCVYPNSGGTGANKPFVNSTWLGGLASCMTQWMIANNKPGFIDQYGVPTSTPGALQYDIDATNIFNAASIGHTFWQYRFPYKSASITAYGPGGDNGAIWQDSSGNWNKKPAILGMLANAWSAAPPPIFGVTSADSTLDPNHGGPVTPNQVAAIFGVHWIRLFIPAGNAAKLAYAASAIQAGYNVQVNADVNCGSTSDAAYRANISTLITNLLANSVTPANSIIVIGNEENADNNKATASITGNVMTVTFYPAGKRLPAIGNDIQDGAGDVTPGTIITGIITQNGDGTGTYNVGPSTPDVASVPDMQVGCTASQYLTDLHSAIQVFHAAGFKVADSGNTYHGIAFAYYYHLMNCQGLGASQCTTSPASDAYWNSTFRWEQTADGMPNSCHPTRAFLARPTDAAQLMSMLKTQAQLTDAITNGQDYRNAHWYKYPPPLTAQTIGWWRGLTPTLPFIVNEMGEYSASGIDMTNMLTEMVSLNPQLLVVFIPDGQLNAVGLLNPDGTLRVGSGYAYRDFVASGPPPHGPPLAGSALKAPALVC